MGHILMWVQEEVEFVTGYISVGGHANTKLEKLLMPVLG